MENFPSHKQKHSKKADNARVSAIPNDARFTLFSQHNRKVVFVSLAGLCLTLVAVGTAQAISSQGSDASSEAPAASASTNTPRSSSEENAAPDPDQDTSASQADIFIAEPPASNSSQQPQTDVTINGQDMSLGADGELRETLRSDDGQTDVSIKVKQNSSSSGDDTRTRSSIRMRNNSSGSVNIKMESSQ